MMRVLDWSKPVGMSHTPGRQWLWRGLAILSISLFATPTLAVHPYERWARELGIDPDVSYDGTRVMEFQGQKVEMTERRAPEKMYTEMYMGNMTVGIILREDLKKSYTLMPSMGFYREGSLDAGLTQASNGLEFSQIEKVGSENINGHPSSKYKARFTDNQGKGAGFIWVTDTGVPIKMDIIYSNKEVKGQRMSMEFTELNLRQQDPKYFEVPSNLKPMGFGAGMSSIGQMMGMGGGAPATESAASGSAASARSDLAAARKRCLQQAAAAAAEAQPKEDKGMFGSLMGAVSELGSMADKFGLSGGDDPVAAAYAPGASAADIEAAAERLGVTPEDIERCRTP